MIDTYDGWFYDLNIWDRIGYKTNYEKHGWSISVRSRLMVDGENVSGNDLGLRLDLTDDEAKRMTLGEEDGDYAPDSDFVLDPTAVLDIYKDVPWRVRLLVALLEGV